MNFEKEIFTMSYLNNQIGYREELLTTRSIIKKKTTVCWNRTD